MFLRHNIAGILWAIFIFILCVLPGSAIPHYRWTDLLSADKLIHTFLFLVLTLLLIRGFRKQSQSAFLKTNAIVIIFLFCLIYGGMLELIQNYWLTDRYGSWFDFIANSVGSASGIWVNTYFKKKDIKFSGFGK